MTETIRIATGGGTGITLTEAELGNTRAVYVDARIPLGGEIVYTPTQPECDEYVAIENHSPFWCRPFFGKDLCDLPERVQALLLRRGEVYRCIMPICAEKFSACA